MADSSSNLQPQWLSEWQYPVSTLFPPQSCCCLDWLCFYFYSFIYLFWEKSLETVACVWKSKRSAVSETNARSHTVSQMLLFDVNINWSLWPAWSIRCTVVPDKWMHTTVTVHNLSSHCWHYLGFTLTGWCMYSAQNNNTIFISPVRGIISVSIRGEDDVIFQQWITLYGWAMWWIIYWLRFWSQL